MIQTSIIPATTTKDDVTVGTPLFIFTSFSVLRDLEPYSEPEREQIRNRRAICKSRSTENLNNFQNEFKNYCHRENM